MSLKAVQYDPKYCEEAKTDMLENGAKPFTRWDSSHDLSVIDSDGKRHCIGHFKHADWASAVGKLIEKHGLDGLT